MSNNSINISKYTIKQLKDELKSLKKTNPNIRITDYKNKSQLLDALIRFGGDNIIVNEIGSVKKLTGGKKLSSKTLMPAGFIGPIKPYQRRKQTPEEKKLKQLARRQAKSTRQFSTSFIGPLLPQQTRATKEEKAIRRAERLADKLSKSTNKLKAGRMDLREIAANMMNDNPAIQAGRQQVENLPKTLKKLQNIKNLKKLENIKMSMMNNNQLF